jgi:hypothetical protein
VEFISIEWVVEKKRVYLGEMSSSEGNAFVLKHRVLSKQGVHLEAKRLLKSKEFGQRH